jgi:hypothetical protein
MLYMVEMELPDRSRLADWHAWYNGHIGKLLTVDGYDGGQRFEAVGPAESPFLAIHDVCGPELFTSVGYTTTGGPSGTGEWRTLMNNWHRNLYDGMATMSAVADGQVLAIVSDGVAVPAAYASQVQWVEGVGLDGSIPRRGVLILAAGDAGTALKGVAGVTLYKPITPKFV